MTNALLCNLSPTLNLLQVLAAVIVLAGYMYECDECVGTCSLYVYVRCNSCSAVGVLLDITDEKEYLQSKCIYMSEYQRTITP